MPERLTDAQIDELLALEAKATPGDWIPEHAEQPEMFPATTVARIHRHRAIVSKTEESSPLRWRANSELIAASRNSIRSLLEEVRERRAAEKSCTQPMTPNDHLDLIYETAIARAEKEGKNRC